MFTPLQAFEILDLRVGRITKAEVNDKARQPAYRLWIDFGELGELTSSAQLTAHYSTDDLMGRLIIAAVNLGQRRIAGFKSQVLVLGAPDRDGRTVLLQPDRDVPCGAKVY